MLVTSFIIEQLSFIRGIKHNFFPFINIHKVRREVLKTEGEGHPQGTLLMLMNDKIMFDHYYCINSTKYCKNENILAHYIFYNITFSYASMLSKICIIRAKVKYS